MHRGLRIFLAARALGLVADEMFIFALPVALYAATKDVRWSGLSLVGLTLTRILFTPIVASLADRFRLRPQYVCVDLGRIVVAAVIFLTPNTPIVVIAFAGILTLLNGHAFVVLEKTVVAISTDKDRSRLQARLQMLEQLARVLGPACAGVVLQLKGIRGVAAVSMASFAISCILVVLYFRPVDHPTEKGHRQPHRDVIQAAKLIISRPRLTWLIGVSMSSNLVEGIMLSLAPMVFLTQFRRAEGDIGVFFSVTAAVSIGVLFALANRKHLHLSHRVGVMLLFGMAAIALLLPFSGKFLTYCGLYLTFIVLRSVFVIHMRTERARLIDAHDFGKVLGLMIALLSLPLPFSGLLVSVAVPRVGANAVLWSTTIVCGAISAALYVWNGRRATLVDATPTVDPQS
ncbi:MFS transporter [Burkholderia cenocepacia]|uniref:MFS transporter n=1 Tax=Burkholderia cenocepacia TaxID=95486 RepID=UPI000F56D5C2|nr:MFS transporter [Burkholderia cenocepacia]RQU33428.1 MFS transporter [Burkholderia cenocepacia]RQU58579.1 MFS transporter [Burkholderia cenocepacia]